MADRKLFWTKTAIKQFEAAIKRIASDSVTNAEKVSSSILKELGKTCQNPEFFPPDKYRLNNTGVYRAFEKHHYRVTYRIADNTISVLRVRHSKMEPKEY